MIHIESHFIEKENYKLHFKRIHQDSSGPAVMLVHGSMEDGRIFYSKSGKGFAPFLAKNGFDVFVVDLRGKGKSIPKIDSKSDFGQKEAIMEDMPYFIEGICSLSGKKPSYIGAHSWGGVITLSYLARFELPSLKALVFFGVKRDIRVQSLYRWINIDLLWNKLGNYAVKKHGFLPAVKYKFGSDNESKKFFLDTNNWVYAKDWIDPYDQYNYAASLKAKKLPPLLSITGSKDTHSGHSIDVKRLINEIGNQENHEFKEVSRSNGYKNDYDHINLLTHKDAKDDHFQEILAWIRKHE